MVLQVNYYLPSQLPAADIAVPLPSQRTADHPSSKPVSMPGSVTTWRVEVLLCSGFLLSSSGC